MSLSEKLSSSREQLAGSLYALLLVPMVGALVVVGGRGFGRSLFVVAVLVAIAACDYAASSVLWAKVPAILDMGFGLALVAIAVAGPWAGFVVLLVPDLIHLARRRKAFWGVGLLANVVSYAALALAGGGVLAVDQAHGVGGHALALLFAGVVVAAVNYTVARLVLAMIRERQRPLSLIRREFVAVLPLELAVIVGAITACLLVPVFGVATLVVFALLVWVPQVAVTILLRAPSVSALSIDAAAAVYRAALVDQLHLSQKDRRRIEQVDALTTCRSIPGGLPDNPWALIQDALVIGVCTDTNPTQRAFSAPPCAQVVLVARGWAQLTAKGTQALNHQQALLALADGPLALDAPGALAAAERIAEREQALTEHTAGVPRLHRVLLPRRARQQLLPRALARLVTT